MEIHNGLWKTQRGVFSTVEPERFGSPRHACLSHGPIISCSYRSCFCFFSSSLPFISSLPVFSFLWKVDALWLANIFFLDLWTCCFFLNRLFFSNIFTEFETTNGCSLGRSLLNQLSAVLSSDQLWDSEQILKHFLDYDFNWWWSWLYHPTKWTVGCGKPNKGSNQIVIYLPRD